MSEIFFSLCQYVNMSVCQYVRKEPKILFTSEPSDQNKSCSECQQDVRNIFFAMSICQYVSMSILFSLGIKMKVVQNVIRTSDSHYVNTSVCQYVNISICQNATFQIRYQNESCSECHQDVRPSLCQYVNMSIGLYVSMSICQNATFQLRYQNESCS